VIRGAYKNHVIAPLDRSTFALAPVRTAVYEVELKFRADHEAVREQLNGANAEQRGTVVQRDTYYDAPHRDFAETDEALRIRRVEREGEAESHITYKGPIVDDESKTRREHETGVDDGKAVAAALDALGFSPAAEVKKRREQFALGDHVVVLDTVEGLGEFVEVEGEAGEGQIDPVRNAVKTTARRLGLDPDADMRTSYLELLLNNDAHK
jgi:adenylate cyclase class 2